MSHNDTIAAIASAAGGAPRGIVRVSGEGVAEVLRRCFISPELDRSINRARACTGHVRLKEPAVELPCRLYYWPTGRSYTGQPSAEFHAIGSPPLLDALLDAVRAAGARLARPGEFTLRAFLAGRIDLTQAEAVLGVIDAKSDAALSAALEQLAGGVATPLRALRATLLDLLADLEAGLDFVDEDIAFITREELIERLQQSAGVVRSIGARLNERDAAEELPRAVLIGPPNAGKSSLFNALIGSQQAIVADSPGTTRDYLVATLDLDGVRCELCDTAGVDATDASDVGRQAQSQRAEVQCRAEIELRCLDASAAATSSFPVEADAARPRIDVWTKADLALHVVHGGVSTSAVTGQGMGELRGALRAQVRRLTLHEGGVRATAARCRGSLEEAAAALARAAQLAETSQGEELVAAEVRAALLALGEVAGAVYTEDLLDRVFSRFCIGK